ncbi:uncharacterized protein DNG_02065 [Cephalotrichum gorgonifer]|uniref:Uncharacterized protein n=1 Tax=Cephalotrichum gorgonifer TaxID=2041049 RepID=A0AAE8SSR6_9PEZI|nr:uncharacterized protein DNG_02065 [Cephalotrichum gorgonifer]
MDPDAAFLFTDPVQNRIDLAVVGLL